MYSSPIDIVNFLWIVFTLGILLPGIYEIFLSDSSGFITKVISYGKLCNNIVYRGWWWKRFLVPKRWFWIFYFVGVVCTSLILLILVGYNGSKLLQLVGLTIYLVHVSRRLYETLYISVFSSNSTINIFHFLLGITYYILTPVSQLLTLSQKSEVSEIRSFDLILCCFLLILQYQQNICFRILANLRTVNNDDDAYIIPKNHLFSYLSCPHFTIEILIYIVFTIYYRFFSAVAFCCLFVVVNQTIAAILNHRWYMQKFGSDYPSSKRILIPFIF